MKIAIVIPALNKLGGTERCMAELSEALASRGHTLVFYCNSKDPSIVPGSTCHHVPMASWPSLARYLSFLIANTIVRGITTRKPGQNVDLVHTTGPDVLFPTVTTLHCSAPACAAVLRARRDDVGRWTSDWKRVINATSYQVIALFERFVVRRGAKRVIVVSNTLRSEVCSYNCVPTRRMEVIPNGVNLEEFHPRYRENSNAIRKELNISLGSPVVAFVGYNWERKGFGTLIDALVRLRAVQPELDPFLLAVGGRGRQSYEKSVSDSLSGRVRFLGPRPDVNLILAASDVCVLPSEQESFGLPILEAMACGIPAIVTRCTGVAELITDEVDGLLLQDSRDVAELTTKLSQILGSRDRGREMGDRARRTAEKYSWDEIAKRVEVVYSGSVSDQRAPV